MSGSETTGTDRDKPRAKARIALPQVLAAIILMIVVILGIADICAAAAKLLLGADSVGADTERALGWVKLLCVLALAPVGWRVARRTWEAPRYKFLLRPKPGSLVFAFRWWSAGWRLVLLALLCSLASTLAIPELALPEGPAGHIVFHVLRILLLAVLILAVLGITARLFARSQSVPEP